MTDPILKKFGKIKKVDLRDLVRKPDGQTFNIQKLIDISHKISVLDKADESRDNSQK